MKLQLTRSEVNHLFEMMLISRTVHIEDAINKEYIVVSKLTEAANKNVGSKVSCKALNEIIKMCDNIARTAKVKPNALVNKARTASLKYNNSHKMVTPEAVKLLRAYLIAFKKNLKAQKTVYNKKIKELKKKKSKQTKLKQIKSKQKNLKQKQTIEKEDMNPLQLLLIKAALILGAIVFAIYFVRTLLYFISYKIINGAWNLFFGTLKLFFKFIKWSIMTIFGYSKDPNATVKVNAMKKKIADKSNTLKSIAIKIDNKVG